MGRVSAPPCAGRNLFALHQEAVGGELGAIADRHAVVDVGGGAEGDVGAEYGVVRLEGAVLLRVALDPAHLVQRAVVADRDKRPLRHTAAVIENPTANLGTHSAQDHVDERGAGEGREIPSRGHLPVPFVAPHRGLVDRAEQHGQRPEASARSDRPGSSRRHRTSGTSRSSDAIAAAPNAA